MKNLKKIVSVLFSTILLFSATTTSSLAIDKLHFVIGGGAGGGWDGTARGTGEALTKAGMLKSASFENMSGGGGGKALAYMINTKPANTVLVQSTPLVLRSITRHKGYVKGNGTLSYKDVVPIAGVIGDYGAIAVAKSSSFKNFQDVVDAYKKDPSSVKMAGGSVRGSMGISDLYKKYEINEIVSGDSIFCATGITSGDLVKGINIQDDEFISETFVTHKSTRLKKVIKLKQKIRR